MRCWKSDKKEWRTNTIFFHTIFFHMMQMRRIPFDANASDSFCLIHIKSGIHPFNNTLVNKKSKIV
jgi:hypothetical protein